MKIRRNSLTGYFLATNPGRSILVLVCLLASGIAEGISVSMLLPLLETMTDAGDAGGRLAGLVKDALARVGLKDSLEAMLVIVAAGMTAKCAILWLAMRQVGYAVARVATELRLSFIQALLKARWSYFAGHPVGSFANTVSSEALVASNAYRHAAMAVACAVELAVYVVLAMLVSWQTALIAVAAGAGVMLLLQRLVRMSKRAGSTQAKLRRSLVARIVDVLHGIKPIKAMALEPLLIPLLEAETEGLDRAQRRKVLATTTLRAFQEPLTVVILVAGLYVAMKALNESFASLLVLAFLFWRLVGKFNLSARYYQGAVGGEASFAAIGKAIRRAGRAEEKATGTRSPPPLTEGIELRNVSFTYGHHMVLREVNLRIPAGAFVAVTGPSGAGKTTVSDLLIGLYRPTEGEILIDNVPLLELDLQAWRHTIGYVPQEMFLLHDSVYRNVTLGAEEISREQVEEVLRAAGAWEFVEQLPEGMDTVVGERGSRISGGQRQRVALARALVRKPRLLVLDEVTTALDPETERAICGTLRELRGKMTIVSISHQRALSEAADIVCHVEAGVVRQVK